MEVGGRPTQDAKAEVIGTTPWMGGGRIVPGATIESRDRSGDRERIRTNIGHIRMKMSGTYFPDRVEEVRERRWKDIVYAEAAWMQNDKVSLFVVNFSAITHSKGVHSITPFSSKN